MPDNLDVDAIQRRNREALSFATEQVGGRRKLSVRMLRAVSIVADPHRPATAEESAQRRQAQERWEERHEEWERATLQRLIKKYGRWGGRATGS